MDGCWLTVDFDDQVDADFFNRRFPPNCIVFVNIPFSDPETFLIRAFILFAYYKVNIVVLMPTRKFNKSAFARDYIRPFVREVGMSTLIFFMLWRIREHGHQKGWLFMLWLGCAGVERFLVEFLRAKDDRFFGVLTVAQIISLAIVAVGVWGVLKTRAAPEPT